MAISWSSRVGNYWQVGVEIVETGRTDTTFTYRYRAYVRSSWHMQLYSSADWECWIDTGSDNSDWHISSGGEQEGRWIDTQNDNPVLLREQSFTVSRTASSRKRVAYARFWGGYNSASTGDRTVSQSLTIPALPTYAPNAVSNVSAALSGSSIKLTWKNNIANLRPYAGIYIDRSVDGGSYSLLKDVSGSSTSYSDTSVSNDHSYTYRVLPHNAAGNAPSHVYSSTLYTAPNAPTGISVVVGGDGSVTVSWKRTPKFELGYDLQYRLQSGGSWGSWTTLADHTTLVRGTSSYVWQDAVGGTLQFRIRTYGRGGLTSGYTTSGSVNSLQPPAAPTILQPVGSVLSTEQVASSGITIVFQHNSLDSSLMTAYQVKVGSSIQTVNCDPSVSFASYKVPATAYKVVDGSSLKVQIRTAGAYVDDTEDGKYGPWCPVQTYTIYSPPDVVFEVPSSSLDTVHSLPYVIKASGTEEGGRSPVRWELSLMESGTVVYSSSGVGSEVEVPLSVESFYPQQGKTYMVTVMVVSSTGLSAAESRSFLVQYNEPVMANLEVSWVPDSLSMSLVVSAPEAGDEVAIESLALYRVVFPAGTEPPVYQNMYQQGSTMVDGSYTVTTDADTNPMLMGAEVEGEVYGLLFDSLDVVSGEPTVLNVVVVGDSDPVVVATRQVSSTARGVVWTGTSNPGYVALTTDTGSVELSGVRVMSLPAGTTWSSDLLDQYPYVPPISSYSTTEVLIESDIITGYAVQVFDNYPYLNTTNVYLVRALAESQASSSRYAMAFADSGRRYALNFGDGFSEVAVLLANLNYEESPEREQNSFLAAGRAYAVTFDGDSFSEPISISAELVTADFQDDAETYRALRDLQRSSSDKILRKPDGSLVFVSTPGLKFGYDGRTGWRTVDVDCEVVDSLNSSVVVRRY